jgi:hypothetical protein
MFYTLVSRSIITKINTSRDYLYIFLIGSIGYVILHWYLHMDKCEGFLEKIREYLYYAMVVDAVTAYALMMFYPPSSKQNQRSQLEKNSENESSGKNDPQYTPEQSKAIIQQMQEARRLQQMRNRALVEQKGPGQDKDYDQDQAHAHAQKITVTKPGANLQSSQIYSNDKKEDESSKENANQHRETKNKEKKNNSKEIKESNESGKKSIFTKSEESKENTDTLTDSNDGIQTNPKKDNTDTDDNKKSKTKINKSDDCMMDEPIKDEHVKDLRVKGKKKDSEIVDTEIPIFEGQKNN